MQTLEREGHADELGLNDIGRVTLRTSAPLAIDPYARNRRTGSFILIDEATNAHRRRRDDHRRSAGATPSSSLGAGAPARWLFPRPGILFDGTRSPVGGVAGAARRGAGHPARLAAAHLR